MKNVALLMVLGAAALATAQCCPTSANAKTDPFLAEAQRMLEVSEGKKACCRSTAAKTVLKGQEGCCEVNGAPAKFKVFVVGSGYKFYGCPGSAMKGRNELVSAGKRVGKVQAIVGAVTM